MSIVCFLTNLIIGDEKNTFIELIYSYTPFISNDSVIRMKHWITKFCLLYSYTRLLSRAETRCWQ